MSSETGETTLPPCSSAAAARFLELFPLPASG
jgi:hypothetical protein